jgi:flagellar biosynthesis/type III secretory pathway chaperone
MPALNRLSPRNAVTPKPVEITLVEATIVLMNELVQLMSAEIDILTERKMEEHKELLKRKQRLTIDYRANMKSIAIQPDLFKKIPDDLRAAAKVAAQKLADMSDRNAKFLRGAVMATQRLIQTIVSIVKQEVIPKSGYSNSAIAHLHLGSYSPTCKPVAVNRTA